MYSKTFKTDKQFCYTVDENMHFVLCQVFNIDFLNFFSNRIWIRIRIRIPTIFFRIWIRSKPSDFFGFGSTGAYTFPPHPPPMPSLYQQKVVAICATFRLLVRTLTTYERRVQYKSCLYRIVYRWFCSKIWLDPSKVLR
jgi:hypothetical protein